ncbi:MAG: helix-turn-helix domain-containing protein [Spirochaetales bacterium]|nr:helix-turn-helix domain-containing protein [Spirochaetales bacterium]
MKHYSTVSLSWTRSILMIVLTILCLCSLILAFDIFQLTKTILRSMESMTEYMQHSMDAQFNEIQKIVISIELNNTNSRIKRDGLDPNAVSQEEYAFSHMISTFTMTNRAVSDIAVYYKDSGMIIGNEGVFPARSYYQLEHNLDSRGFEEWSGGILSGSNGFRLIDTENTRQFSYVKKMVHRDRVVGAVILTLDTDELVKPMESLRKPDQERLSFGILLNGMFIALSGISKEAYPESLELKSETDSYSYTRSRYQIHIRPSQLPGIHYLNAYYLPYTLRPLILSLLVFIPGILIIGLFAAYLSLRISSRNSEPIEKILSKLGRIPRTDMDEYRMISSRIDTLLDEKDSQLSKMQSQQNMIEGLYLNLLLNTDMQSEQELKASARLFSINFQLPYHMIAVVKVSSDENRALGTDIQNWMKSKGLSVIVCYLRQRYILMINLSDPSESRFLHPVLEELLHDDLWSKSPVAGVGHCTDTLGAIGGSYIQALTALHETTLQQPGTAVLYHRGMALIEDEKTVLHLRDFTMALKEHSFIRMRKHFELFFARCVSGSDTVSELRQSFSSMEGLLRGTAQSIGVELDEIGTPFFTYNAPKELRKNVLVLLDRFEKMDTPSAGKETSATPAERARDIIRRDYTDPMLGLYRIAEYLEVSNTYLSTSFKSTYGIGIVQYINQLRIELAKDLIMNTSMSIKDIAASVGFSSSISFIRVFKKSEGMTPNSMRKS